MALAQLVPAALAAPAAASLGDRFPRQRVLAAGYVVQAVAMVATALMPSLARAPAELIAANAAGGVVEGAGVLIGPLAAAVVLTVSTPAVVFLFGGGAMALAAAATIGLRPIGGLDAADETGPDDDIDPTSTTSSSPACGPWRVIGTLGLSSGC